jgi:hypothetical protein
MVIQLARRSPCAFLVGAVAPHRRQTSERLKKGALMQLLGWRFAGFIRRFDLEFNRSRGPPVVFNLQLFEIRQDHVNVIQHSLETDGERQVQLEI